MQVTRKTTTDALQKRQVKSSEKPTFLYFNINNDSFILVAKLMRIISSRQYIYNLGKKKETGICKQGPVK